MIQREVFSKLNLHFTVDVVRIVDLYMVIEICINIANLLTTLIQYCTLPLCQKVGVSAASKLLKQVLVIHTLHI